MDPNKISSRKFTIFMIVAFGVAYIPLTLAGYFLDKGNTVAFTVLFRFVAVFIPLIAVLVARLPLRDLGFRLGKFKYIIAALMGSQILSWIGAAIFFAFFHDGLKISLDGLTANFPEEVTKTLGTLPVDPKMVLVLMIMPSLTFIPISQILPSLGEEAGWRGVMYPFLKEKLGDTKGRLLGGALWGIWHWPLMILGGHFFGKEYIGSPVLGPVAVCISLCAFGILIDHLYEKTHSIWIASLAHSAMNAAAIPLMLISVSDPSLSVFGPTNFALIPVIPVIIADIVIIMKSRKT